MEISESSNEEMHQRGGRPSSVIEKLIVNDDTQKNKNIASNYDVSKRKISEAMSWVDLKLNKARFSYWQNEKC